MPRLTYDAAGTPGIWAASAAEAYAGIGWLHGRHRPLQALLLGAAGRGRLAEHLLPLADLVHLDALCRRLDLPALAAAEVNRLDGNSRALLDGYLVGFSQGVAASGEPWELRLLLARLPPLDHVAVLAGMLLSSYLGLAEGQERMERALVDALAAGADPTLLTTLFAPNLEGWEPERLRRLPRRVVPGFAAHGLVTGAGSNAWAVTGERSASGRPMLCGDPHLQVNQLPALFFELRARVGDDYWLGATIPGLPGVAIGRNRRVAWSGTFAVADNVDFFIERLVGGRLCREVGGREPVLREVEVRRRFLPPLRLRLRRSEHGVIEGDAADGDALAVSWCGARGAAETLAAYLALPSARSAAEAEQILTRAHAYSLHWVLTDAGGDVRYCQAGRVPRREGGWSGLFPVPADGPRRWRGFYEGECLPREGATEGMVVSANEARPAADGATLATLAQPEYRRRRIRELLLARPRHDRDSMRTIQRDQLSLQALAMRPLFLPRLRPGPMASALAAWDGRYGVDQRGAHAFACAYRACLGALAPELGGDWLHNMLDASELGIWWLSAFDRFIADDGSWAGGRGERLTQALAAISDHEPRAWGEVQRFELRHPLLGALPGWLGQNRGPYPLDGSVATVCQGNVVRVNGRSVATAPAWRMICDLAHDELWTSLPGGIDGSPRSPTYACWLDEWRRGEHHRLAPPADEELQE